MCGLVLAPTHYSREVEDALKAMGYRGEPGRIGVAAYGDWAIGHTRLAIQDLSDAGSQPIIGVDQVTAFVGEVFNLPEREAIEVAAETGVFHHLDGFWAVATILRGKPIVYTDHLGIKPLYWWPKKKIVCSEIEPMFAFDRPPPFDEVYLSNCIKFGYDYSGRTPYEGIVQLPPGTRLEVDTGRMTSHWDWAKVQLYDEFRQMMNRAIRNRLVGDREVALLLSGGLDSSIVYHTLQELGHPVRAFSIENGESEFLPEGVEPLAIGNTTTAEAVGVMQAPLDLGSLLPQVQLARAVADAGFNVCLTGDGADELFGGYRRSQEYDSQKSDVFCELPYYHLPRLDRVMMRSTIELRSPFLAPQVVAYALRLPRSLRTGKRALKIEYRGTVPDRIIDRPKHPLKTEAVIQGGQEYRAQLVSEFRQHVQAYI